MRKPSDSSTSILLATCLVALVLALIVWALSGLGKGSRAPADGDAADARIAPVARFELLAAKAAAGAKDPQSVYAAVCAACHGTGAAGAPKKGDKAAWAPRLAQGLDALVKSATAGKGAMPPKGGAANLSDAEFKAVVEYLSK